MAYNDIKLPGGTHSVQIECVGSFEVEYRSGTSQGCSVGQVSPYRGGTEACAWCGVRSDRRTDRGGSEAKGKTDSDQDPRPRKRS